MSTTLLNSSSIQLCDSTSGSPNIYNVDSKQTDGTLIPQVTRTTFITTFKMTLEGEKCVIEAATASAVSGSMGVLLGGANVPRVIHIPFGSSSISSLSGTTEVTTGSQGLLPTLAEGQSYSLQSVAIPGYDISPSVFTILPTLIGTSSVSLKLCGYSITTGTSTMVVQNPSGSSFTIDLTFSSETELVGSKGAATADSTKLKYGEDYRVTSITHSPQTIFFSTSLSFTVPCPPAILSSFTPTTDSDWMTLVFSGSGLVADSYTLTLTEQNPSGTTHTKEITLSRTSDTTLNRWNITLFPSISADLKYGTKYKVSRMESSIAVQSVTLPSFVITTPAEPSRVMTIVLERYSDSDKLAEFKVDGVAMTEDTTYKLILNETGTISQTSFIVTCLSTTVGTGSAVLFSSSSSSVQLNFNTNYTVTGVKDSTNQDVLFVSGLIFHTKAEPTRLVTFTSCSDSMVRNEQFWMTGRALDLSAQYRVGLSVSGVVNGGVEMSFNTKSKKWEGSASLFPLSGAELEFGTTYSVSSLTKGTDPMELLFETQSVTIQPEPARLVSATHAESASPNSTNLVLESRLLTKDAEYEIALSFSPSSSSSMNTESTSTLIVTVTSETYNSFTLSLYPLSTASRTSSTCES
ncbi:hypothetical protein BLNAU_14071 [Blattamonas nauphoetae]|uniref:Uncharacterized protein n=1 Tax=Blattamonas nauphoetae TaxID=2049346 RepID=A0ABQ9XEU4_9EUKA|nr:hypothetical protein BLNAU_14071 [Blattamonas nauphoetae]